MNTILTFFGTTFEEFLNSNFLNGTFWVLVGFVIKWIFDFIKSKISKGITAHNVSKIEETVKSHSFSIAEYHKNSRCIENTTKISTLKDEIRDGIYEIKILIAEMGGSKKKEVVLGKSPIKLTELGLEIYEKAGCRKIFEENKDIFISELEKRNPSTALDVQDCAKIAVYDLSSREFFAPIKNYIYHNPEFKNEKGKALIDLDMSTISFILGILIRDEYFSRHPEIKIDL